MSSNRISSENSLNTPEQPTSSSTDQTLSPQEAIKMILEGNPSFAPDQYNEVVRYIVINQLIPLGNENIRQKEEISRLDKNILNIREVLKEAEAELTIEDKALKKAKKEIAKLKENTKDEKKSNNNSNKNKQSKPQTDFWDTGKKRKISQIHSKQSSGKSKRIFNKK